MEVTTIAEQLFFTTVRIDTDSANDGQGSGTGFFLSHKIIAAVFFRIQMNQIIPVPVPTQVQPMTQQQEMIDLGIVFKAHTVAETVEAFLKAHNVETSAPRDQMPPTQSASV